MILPKCGLNVTTGPSFMRARFLSDMLYLVPSLLCKSCNISNCFWLRFHRIEFAILIQVLSCAGSVNFRHAIFGYLNKCQLFVNWHFLRIFEFWQILTLLPKTACFNYIFASVVHVRNTFHRSSNKMFHESSLALKFYLFVKC